MRKEIEAVEQLGGHRLRLAYTDGEHFELDFWPRISPSRLLEPLRDESVFNELVLGPGGRSLEWPELDLGFCADALWLDGHPDELKRVEAAAAEPVAVLH